DQSERYSGEVRGGAFNLRFSAFPYAGLFFDYSFSSDGPQQTADTAEVDEEQDLFGVWVFDNSRDPRMRCQLPLSPLNLLRHLQARLLVRVARSGLVRLLMADKR